EHNIPSLWASIRRVILVRTSLRDAPMSIIFNASSTASLGRVWAEDGELESSGRLGNVLTFAINWPPTPAASHKQSTYITKGRRGSNIAQQRHVVARNLCCASAFHWPLPRVSPHHLIG